jgi:hypothetical protein
MKRHGTPREDPAMNPRDGAAEEVEMNTWKMFAVIAINIANIAGLTSCCPAAAETRFSAPAALNETIYRPDCPSDDADRSWHPGTICDSCR